MADSVRALTLALAPLSLAVGTAVAQAPFTPGNLVVARLGDTTTALAATGTPVFLDEYTQAGTLVQSIPLPTTGANQITSSGTATTEGFLTLSGDGQYLIYAGYRGGVGTTVTGTTSTAVPRVVARISLAGVANVSTAINDGNSPGNPRSATSNDGSQFWMATSAVGVRYATLGGTTSTLVSATPTNTRVVNVFNNQLYMACTSGTFQGVSTIGSGLPTTSGNTTTLLQGFPTAAGPSCYDFAFANANTLYVADDRTIANGGGLQKWTFNGVSWTLAATYNGGLAAGLRGVTLVAGSSPVKLFATSAETAANKIWTLTDNGPGSSFTLVATAVGTSMFRGVRSLPAGPAAPSITTNPTSVSTTCGNPATFSVVATGAAPLTYAWRKDGTPIPGATSNTYSIGIAVVGDSGTFDCVVTNAGGSTTSNGAVLTVTNVAPNVSAVSPAGAALCAGASVTFSVSSTSPAVTYEWLKDSVVIPGATTASYTIAAVGPGDAGLYSARVQNPCGALSTSGQVALTINDAAAVSVQPTDVTTCSGTPAAFSVTATGTAPISYQWRFNGSPIGGATSSTLNLPAVLAGDAGAYDCVVTNACGTATSAIAVLAVDAAIAITAHPTDVTTCAGMPAAFAVTALGAAPISYQWRKNGLAIGGAISNTLNIAAVTAAEAGAYDCEITNGCGTTTSAIAVLTVNEAPVATGNPVDATVCENDTANFTVAATGTEPLSYQWRKNGSPIQNATASTFSVVDATPADAGAYDCEITNACGSTVSTAATLTVNANAVITQQPVDVTTCAGSAASFSVTTTGAEPITYLWRRNGSTIASATSATLSFAAVTVDDAGSYDCLVTNACESTISTVAVLTVNDPIAITAQPTDVTACAGTPAAFAVTVTGTAPINYQWRLNGLAIGGAINSTLNLAAVLAADAGAYDCEITNGCGSTTSAIAVLTVDDPIAITAQPTDVTACAGTPAAFAVTATGTAPISYQWRLNGLAIGGATSSTLNLAAVLAADAGAYDCEITNGCGSTTSAIAVLTVDDPIAITAQPTDVTTCAGTPAAFSVTATGTAPISYQWRLNGLAIGGAINSTLNLAAVLAADAGAYDCEITNGCGSTTSAVAVLTVDDVAAVQTQPTGASVLVGNPVTFTVVASSSTSMTFQWRKNGSPIPGATNTSYTIAAAALTDSGSYDVVITNTCGAVTSSSASLAVTDVASLQVQCRSIGSGPLTIAIADVINGNGSDVIVADASTNFLRVLANNGNGQLVAQPVIPVAAGPRDLAIADFDGDGNLDIAVACATGGVVQVIYTDGVSAFSFPATIAATAPTSVAAVAVLGHAQPDLAICDGSTLAIAPNDANTTPGVHTWSPSTLLATGGTFSDVAIGDVSGDGNGDIVATDSTTNSAVAYTALTLTPAMAPIASGLAPVALAIGDLDGDGRADLAVAGSSGTLLLRTPALTTTVVDATPAVSVAIGRFDIDDKVDVAYATASGSSAVVHDASGVIAPSNIEALPSPAAATSVTAGSIDPTGQLAGPAANTDELVVGRSLGDLCIVRFRARAESTTIAGTGCGGPTPTHSVFGGLPTLGNAGFGSQLAAATPSSFCVLAYQAHQPSGSPLVLSNLGLCTHAFDANSDAPLLFGTTDAIGQSSMGLAVPTNVIFVGVEFKLQWAVLDGGDPFTGLTLSPAILLRIGEY